jgi:hypothetical protein
MGLKKEEERSEAVEKINEIQDFKKLTVAKDMPTISVNRYKNKELYQHGQLMDRDVPIYHRVSGCKVIVGLEG